MSGTKTWWLGGVALLAFFAFFFVVPVRYFLDWGDDILNALAVALAVGLVVNLATMPVAMAISSYVDGERTLDRVDSGAPYFVFLRSFAIEGDLVNYGRMPFPSMFLKSPTTHAIFGLGTQIKEVLNASTSCWTTRQRLTRKPECWPLCQVRRPLRSSTRTASRDLLLCRWERVFSAEKLIDQFLSTIDRLLSREGACSKDYSDAR